MAFTRRPVLHPKGQPFVANEPDNTRRYAMALSGTDGFVGVRANTQDLVIRQSFTLPFTPVRYRFRICNNDLFTNSTTAGPYTLAGIYVGTPASSGLTVWNGVFASAPTAVITAQSGSGTGSQTLDPSGTGAEWVTNWNTTPLPSPGQAFAVSLGFSASSSLFNYTAGTPGQGWAAASGTAISAQVGNTTWPPTGGAGAGPGFLDIRIEWEYIGNNPIGLFIGTSLETGYLNGSSVYGNAGPDECWPNMVGLRTGHAIINGGVGGGTTSTWDGTPSASRCWNRFFDPSYPTPVWPGGCTPDYAVISLGVNDAATNVTLATFQTNIAAIIANLNSLGIYRIFICTIPPVPGTAGWSSGTLQAARTNAGGPYTNVTMIADQGTTSQILPNGGYPGPSTLWTSATGFWLGLPEMGTLNGQTSNTAPYAITSASGAVTGTLTLTVPSFTPGGNFQFGDPCLGAWEGYRKLYNRWLRQHVLGTMGTLDLSSISEGAGYISQYPAAANTNTLYQGGRVRPEWYGATTGPHPQDPSMYEAWASTMTPQLIGI